jgi:hypothetical protein
MAEPKPDSEPSSRETIGPARWRTPEELVEVAVQRSRLVLANEAHNNLRRSIRARRVGARMIIAAHELGVRHLAMEALYSRDLVDRANRSRRLPHVNGGYLAQPEMRELIGTALECRWTLIAYEADLARKPEGLSRLSREETNWREEQQARNITNALAELPDPARLLVWCGNHHLAKRGTEGWRPMGSQLQELSGVQPFAIDQVLGVRFDESRAPVAAAWTDAFTATLTAMGGTAGFLVEDAPSAWPYPHLADAYLLSTENELT